MGDKLERGHTGKGEAGEYGGGGGEEKGTPPNHVSAFSVVFEALSLAGSEPWLQTGQGRGH